jgi:hypothetical protein
VLAKFGYARKTFRQLRAEAAAAPQGQVGRTVAGPTARPRPAPTKRTSNGPTNRPQKKKR